jgi:single-stranded-DNA-specific exonuclease
LEELNRDRQAVEERILRAATEQIEEWPEAKRRRRAYVLWGEDWHEGVIGIVASRLVERYHRPVVLVAGTDGLWKGSGRSIPTFDLHAALGECAHFLERWGGHRAAAGLSIVPELLDSFADAFAMQAEAALGDDDMTPTTVVDAVLPRGAQLTLDLCTELRRLAPFGLGNPAVTLLAPACELAELATVGEGKHLRFRVRRDGVDAGSAIAFGHGGQLDRYRRVGHYDVAFRLEENHWNGTVAPQLVVRRVFDSDDRFEEVYAWLREQWTAPRRDTRAQQIFDELALEEGGPRRHPLESATFREVLAEPALRRAA